MESATSILLVMSIKTSTSLLQKLLDVRLTVIVLTQLRTKYAHELKVMQTTILT